jgi:hypothetical protein
LGSIIANDENMPEHSNLSFLWFITSCPSFAFISTELLAATLALFLGRRGTGSLAFPLDAG